ncbi:MAG: dihydrofolate reductase [Oceanobacter sp.]
MKLALIVAMASNRVIGVNNELPWHLPNDLKYFKEQTMGKPLVMGRKTFDSIGRPLPGRPNIVVTRSADFQPEGVIVTSCLEDAVQTGTRLAVQDGVDEVMVIGGANIYGQVISLVERMYLTEVDAKIEGDAHFPLFDRDDWREIERISYPACDKNPYPYAFVVYDRIRPARIVET